MCGGGQHRVFGGQPTPPRSAPPRRDPVGDAGGTQHPGMSEFDQHRTGRVAGESRVNLMGRSSSSGSAVCTCRHGLHSSARGLTRVTTPRRRPTSWPCWTSSMWPEKLERTSARISAVDVHGGMCVTARDADTGSGGGLAGLDAGHVQVRRTARGIVGPRRLAEKHIRAARNSTSSSHGGGVTAVGWHLPVGARTQAVGRRRVVHPVG